jgi:hypothetical protein
MQSKSNKGFFEIIALIMFLAFLTFMTTFYSVLDCNNGCREEVPPDGNTEQMYQNGYDVGYLHATRNAGYQTGCQSETEGFCDTYNEGYDDGYQAGGGEIPYSPPTTPPTTGKYYVYIQVYDTTGRGTCVIRINGTEIVRSEITAVYDTFPGDGGTHAGQTFPSGTQIEMEVIGAPIYSACVKAQNIETQVTSSIGCISHVDYSKETVSLP